MNPLFKAYKSKVMKTLNPDAEEEPVEEVSEVAEDLTPVQPDEGPSSVTQFAKRMQGVGAKGWKSVSSLFNKDDEHQLLEAETDNQPVPDHPLAVRPEEPPQRPGKRATGFWDNFATKWHQAAAMKQSEAAAGGATDTGNVAEAESGREGQSQEEGNQGGMENEAGEEGGGRGNSFSKYASLGGANDDATSFKWNFVTGKLAELKSKSMTKSN